MRKGFTLIEIIVVLAIFGILIVAGSDFLISVIQNSNRARVENEVRQNANRILQELENSIRKADCVSWTIGDPLNNRGNVFLTTYSGSCGGAVLDSYQFWFDADVAKKTNSGKVFRNGQPFIATTSATVNCPGASQQCASNWSSCSNGFSVSGQSGTNRAVTVSLTVQATTSARRSDFCAVTKLSETIAPRVLF